MQNTSRKWNEFNNSVLQFCSHKLVTRVACQLPTNPRAAAFPSLFSPHFKHAPKTTKNPPTVGGGDRGDHFQGSQTSSSLSERLPFGARQARSSCSLAHLRCARRVRRAWLVPPSLASCCSLPLDFAPTTNWNWSTNWSTKDTSELPRGAKRRRVGVTTLFLSRCIASFNDCMIHPKIRIRAEGLLYPVHVQ